MERPRRRLHIRRWVAAFALAELLVLPSGDRLHITPALDVASEHSFSLVQWHITNFFGKWGHLLRERMLGQRPSREEHIAIVDEYLQTSRLAEKEERLIEGRIARAGGANSAKGANVSREYLDELLGIQRGLRPKAEEAVESELSAVLLNEGFGWWGDALFPPVDIRFGHLPTIIVTSRRDKIARVERRLLRPELEYIERGRLEDELLEKHDLSAIVGNLAGLSTYPTLVTDTDSLRSVLRTAAHEWLHVYWFFRPFGQAFWTSEEMATLNETAADIAGRELGDETFARMGGDLTENARRYLPQEERDPRFTRMMRETRQRTEELLTEGKVAEAEEYMKDRWWLMRLGGYGVRKLNQAYFAMHGIYGESVTSVSPIGDEVAEFRTYFASTGDFVRALNGVSTYGEFLERLGEKQGQFVFYIKPESD